MKTKKTSMLRKAMAALGLLLLAWAVIAFAAATILWSINTLTPATIDISLSSLVATVILYIVVYSLLQGFGKDRIDLSTGYPLHGASDRQVPSSLNLTGFMDGVEKTDGGS